MQETGVPSLSWEDPLEKEMATHFSILTWENSCKMDHNPNRQTGAWQAQVYGITKSQMRLSS